MQIRMSLASHPLAMGMSPGTSAPAGVTFRPRERYNDDAARSHGFEPESWSR